MPVAAARSIGGPDRCARLAAGVLVLAACCALLAPAALAQSVHVTNLGQTEFNHVNALFAANGFTTGGATTDRFTLTSVVIDFDPASSSAASWVRVYNKHSVNNIPGTQRGGNLVKQGSAIGGNITFNAPASGITLNGGTTYFVVVNTAAGSAFFDSTNSDSEDSSSSTGWSIANFAYTSSNGTSWTAQGSSLAMRFRVNATTADTTAPTLAATNPLTPADNAANVAVDANLVIRFSEAVKKGTGNITINPASGSAITIPVTSGQVSVGSGANAHVVTIDPANDLAGETDYHVRIASTAFDDLVDNSFAGIGDNSTWNFTTADTTPPAFGSATVNGSTLAITFSEAMDAASTPAASVFEVTVAGSNRTVSSYSLSGSTATLTLSSAVAAGQTVTVAYAKPGSGSVLQDTSGNDLASFGAENVTNTTGDTTPPAFASATVNGAALTVTFSENMDAASKPAASVFEVTVAGTNRTVSSYTLSGSTATLTLSSAVGAGQAVTVAYAKPGSGSVLQDTAGNDLASFGAQTVTNETPSGENVPPTGRPRIVGTPQVGATLTADTSGISDANGLTDPAWKHVWHRYVTDDQTAREPFLLQNGGASYTPVANDAGTPIQVTSYFTDDAGFGEQLKSDPVTVSSGGGGGPGPPPGGGDDDGDEDDQDGDEPAAPCGRHVAPYWHGEAVLVLRSANGRSVEVETACGGETATSTEFGGLIVREASCENDDGTPLVGSLAVEGAAPGGWYYVRGDRNVAVAPLMCSSHFEGGTVRAATVGGTTSTRSDNGTFVSHHATRLIGIVPDLPAGGTGSLKAPYWRGWGGIVGRAANGEYVDVDYGCEIVPVRLRLAADPDTGVVSSLLRPANCRSEDGRLFTGDLKVTGMEDGGWYWLNGPNGGPPAVAPLVRSSLLGGDMAVDPGNPNVAIHRGRDGTLFEETKTDLSGVVPHLED